MHILQFCPDVSKKSKSVIYLHLQVLIALFLETVSFIMLWFNIRTILLFENDEFC